MGITIALCSILEKAFCVVLPLLHNSHESGVVEFAIHLLRDITMNDTRFDYPLVFRTYPGSILLSLASVVNSRNADDGFSERVRELASSTLSVYVDGFEYLAKEKEFISQSMRWYRLKD